MALHKTAREANVYDSWKKYLVDSLWTAEGIDILFGKFVPNPKVRDKSISRWVTVNHQDIERSKMSRGTMDLFCATQKDPEWFRLAQLCDTVMGYLTVDPDDPPTDGLKRVPFYRSKPGGSAGWELIDNLLIQDVLESGQLETDTDTKFKIITVIYRFASKV